MEDDHRHCRSCGKVTAPGQDTCSDSCRQKREGALQSRRNFTYLLYGLMILIVILSIYRGF
jgi:predicted nucleic acid-binding Zn ribbon protein